MLSLVKKIPIEKKMHMPDCLYIDVIVDLITRLTEATGLCLSLFQTEM